MQNIFPAYNFSKYQKLFNNKLKGSGYYAINSKIAFTSIFPTAAKISIYFWQNKPRSYFAGDLIIHIDSATYGKIDKCAIKAM